MSTRFGWCLDGHHRACRVSYTLTNGGTRTCQCACHGYDTPHDVPTSVMRAPRPVVDVSLPPQRVEAVTDAVTGPVCSVPGCDRPAKTKGMCKRDYNRQWREQSAAWAEYQEGSR